MHAWNEDMYSKSENTKSAQYSQDLNTMNGTY